MRREEKSIIKVAVFCSYISIVRSKI